MFSAESSQRPVRHVRFVALIAATLAACRSAQPIRPSGDTWIQGSVRDERDAPIAGANVSLTVHWPWPDEGFDDWLPHTLTDADGRFRLPLGPELLSLETSENGVVLLVESPGRQPWCEPIPSPLGTFRGSDVLLPNLLEDERATIRVEAPRPGTMVQVRRAGGEYGFASGPPEAGLGVHAVPSSGELHVAVPLLPNPLRTPPGQNGFVPLGWQARLLSPGRCTDWQPVHAGDVVTFPAPGREPPSRPVRRSDGQPVSGARVLLDLGSATRWFDLPGTRVPDDPVLPALYVTADGCVATRVDDACREFLVEPLPPGPRDFVVVNTNGNRLRGVEAIWTPVSRPRLAYDSPRGHHWLLADGNLRLASERLGLGSLCLWNDELFGHFEQPGLLPEAQLVLDQPNRTIRVLVHDDQGRPIPGAHVSLLADGPDGMVWGTWRSAEGRPAVTDDDGSTACAMAAHFQRVRVIAAGWSFPVTPIDGDTVQVIGQRLIERRVESTDASGRPAPFVNFGTRDADEFAEWRWYSTDSRGSARCFVLPAERSLVAERAGPPSREPPPNVPSAEAPLVPLTAAGLALVRIPAPDDRDRALCFLRRGEDESNRFAWWRLPTATEGLLLRWDPGLDLLCLGVRAAPPVLVPRDDLSVADPLSQLDRRFVTRRVRLHLIGDVPDSLAGLVASPRTYAGHELPALVGNASDVDSRGAIWLLARDERAHGVWILHPDLEPARAELPPADGEDRVTVPVREGVPLMVRSTRGNQAGPVFVTLERDGEALGRGELLWTGPSVPFRAPFALPRGHVQLSVQFPSEGRPRTFPLDIRGAEPVTLDID